MPLNLLIFSLGPQVLIQTVGISGKLRGGDMTIYKSDEKIKLKQELKELQKNGEAPSWMMWFSWAMLKEGYLYESKTPRERYRQIAKAAASYLPEDKDLWEDKFFDLIWKNWLAPSTPVLGNLGTNRGMSVSCSGSIINDTMWDIAYTDYEISMLSSQGFGTAAFLNVRAGNQPIRTGGVTNPTRDWVEMIWHTQNKVNQGSLRRGSTAIYLDFWHEDLLNILPMLETHDKLHLGVICDDKVKTALAENDPKAMNIYREILTWRARKGKPYIIFISNAQRQDPDCYKKLGLSSKHSQLCTEIFLHTDSEHTFSCVLSSMCGHTFDEWKDTDAVFTATVFLDCIAQDLIERGSKIKGLERVVAFTKKSRALGLGLLGFHSYLQQKMIPLDDLRARFHNKIIFEHIHNESLRASKYMAEWLGEPEWCSGTGLRNTHRTAVAPNTSSAFFSGGQSQGIEPLVANVFTQKLSMVGAVDRMPAQLVKILKEKGKYGADIIESITEHKGSVQQFDFLTEDEKSVFKTAYEINQKVLIDLAEQRQPYICQGQSLNLFFDANEDEQWIHEVHKYAFEQKLLKSLYYVRTMAGISASKSDSCLACEG